MLTHREIVAMIHERNKDTLTKKEINYVLVSLLKLNKFKILKGQQIRFINLFKIVPSSMTKVILYNLEIDRKIRYNQSCALGQQKKRRWSKTKVIDFWDENVDK